MNGGFVKLYRKMLGWEWYTDQNTKCLFLHLLLTVNYKESKWRGITVPKGARVVSIRTLAKELKISEQSVRTAIKHLVQTGEISVTVINDHWSLVQVDNFSRFQRTDTKSNTKNDTKSNTNEIRANACISMERKHDSAQGNTKGNTKSNTKSDTTAYIIYKEIKEIEEGTSRTDSLGSEPAQENEPQNPFEHWEEMTRDEQIAYLRSINNCDIPPN